MSVKQTVAVYLDIFRISCLTILCRRASISLEEKKNKTHQQICGTPAEDALLFIVPYPYNNS